MPPYTALVPLKVFFFPAEGLSSPLVLIWGSAQGLCQHLNTALAVTDAVQIKLN